MPPTIARKKSPGRKRKAPTAAARGASLPKDWHEVGLDSVPTRQILSVFAAHGLPLTLAEVKALAAEHFPEGMTDLWARRWPEHEEPWKFFPSFAADALFNRCCKDTLPPRLVYTTANGILAAMLQPVTEPAELAPTVAEAAALMVKMSRGFPLLLPAAGVRRSRFSVEVRSLGGNDFDALLREAALLVPVSALQRGGLEVTEGMLPGWLRVWGTRDLQRLASVALDDSADLVLRTKAVDLFLDEGGDPREASELIASTFDAVCEVDLVAGFSEVMRVLMRAHEGRAFEPPLQDRLAAVYRHFELALRAFGLMTG